jgi:hypothetical protein
MRWLDRTSPVSRATTVTSRSSAIARTRRRAWAAPTLRWWSRPARRSGTSVKIPAGAIPDEDCIPYDPGNLGIEDLGDLGWRLNSRSIAMVLVDNADDASKLRELASYYSQQCFIGRDNNRADRYRYIVDYWK